MLSSGRFRKRGRYDLKNEDHFLVSHISRKQEILITNVPADNFPDPIREDGYTMVVADGMGGMAAGEVASRMAISTGMKLFHKSPKWGFRINQKEARDLFERVNSRLQEIDRTLTEESYGNRRLFGMGTTLTAAYSVGVDLFIIHVGDSRHTCIEVASSSSLPRITQSPRPWLMPATSPRGSPPSS